MLDFFKGYLLAESKTLLYAYKIHKYAFFSVYLPVTVNRWVFVSLEWTSA